VHVAQQLIKLRFGASVGTAMPTDDASRLALALYNQLLLSAETFDPQRDDVAGLEPNGLWLHSHPYAGRGTGGNDVAG
jgi:hypothetical protein